MITSASMNKEFRGVVTQFDVSKEYGFIKEEITGKSFFSRYEKNEQIL
jgi:cold shock CspA family protein